MFYLVVVLDSQLGYLQVSQMPPQPAVCTSYNSSGSGCVHKHCLSRLLWYKCGSGSSAAGLALSGSNQTSGCSQAVLLRMSAVVSSAPDRKGVVGVRDLGATQLTLTGGLFWTHSSLVLWH